MLPDADPRNLLVFGGVILGCVAMACAGVLLVAFTLRTWRRAVSREQPGQAGPHRLTLKGATITETGTTFHYSCSCKQDHDAHHPNP